MALAPVSSRGGFTGGTVTGATVFNPADRSQTAVTVENSTDGDLLDLIYADTPATVGAFYVGGSGANVAGRMGLNGRGSYANGLAYFDARGVMILTHTAQTITDGDKAIAVRLESDPSTDRFGVTLAGLVNARGAALSPITSAALPTQAFVSGAGAQILTTRDVDTITPLATDGTANAATCAVALSPDNVTYSTLCTVGASAAVNTVGAITIPVNVHVPAGWYLKFTVVHATLGTTTYY